LDGKEQYQEVAIPRDMRVRFDSIKARQAGNLQRRHIRRRGIAFIWVAIFLLLLILIVGLSLDSGMVLLAAHQLQNTADAAALAGAQVVKFDQNLARQQAMSIALENFVYRAPVSLADSDIVVGVYYPQRTDPKTRFEPTIAGGFANAVRVFARRTDSSLGGPIALTFGPIAGVPTSNVARYAIAISSGTTGAGLICLDPCGTGLSISAGTIDVQNGDVQVNSGLDRKPWAMDVGGSWIMNANELNVCGVPNDKFDWATVPYPINKGASPIPDPLRNLPPPNYTAFPIRGGPKGELNNTETVKIGKGQVTLDPGYYPGGFSITGGNVTLRPGIYALGGAGLNISGTQNATFTARGVMFYITKSTPEMGGVYGKVDITGGPTLVVTPPALNAEPPDPPASEYPAWMDWIYAGDEGKEGISIFQDRANTNEARIIGSSGVVLLGTLYFSKNSVELGGGGYQAGSQLIAWSVRVHGSTAEITINYDGRNRVRGYWSYLVE
jgi:Flp pilus assembly protein TadG